MKYLLLFSFNFIFNIIIGQTLFDTTTFSYLCKNKFGLNFEINENYFQTDHKRAFIPTYNTYSCLPYFFREALINKKFKDHYIIYFEFNEVASSKEEEFKNLKIIQPDFDKNKNYLCQSGKREREKGLINIFSKKDFKKFNADTILCIRVDTLARVKNDPNFNNFIYVVAHKMNVGDIYVCFAFKKEFEDEIIEEIKNLWKIINFQ
jgi:hypothetical protein